MLYNPHSRNIIKNNIKIDKSRITLVKKLPSVYNKDQWNKIPYCFALTLRISVAEEKSATQISQMEAATHKLMTDLELQGFRLT
jgi:hypothetical protein